MLTAYIASRIRWGKHKNDILRQQEYIKIYMDSISFWQDEFESALYLDFSALVACMCPLKQVLV